MTPAPQPADDEPESPTGHFRCSCGRSVAAPIWSEAVVVQACSRCRRRHHPDEVLRRTDVTGIVTRS